MIYLSTFQWKESCNTPGERGSYVHVCYFNLKTTGIPFDLRCESECTYIVTYVVTLD